MELEPYMLPHRRCVVVPDVHQDIAWVRRIFERECVIESDMQVVFWERTGCGPGGLHARVRRPVFAGQGCQRAVERPPFSALLHSKNSRGSRPKNSSSAIPPEPITRARAPGCFRRNASSPKSFPPRPLLTSNAHTRRPRRTTKSTSASPSRQ